MSTDLTRTTSIATIFATFALFGAPTVASAQDNTALAMVASDDDPDKKVDPYDQPDLDPTPKPPRPVTELSDPSVVKQAGTGGTVAYSESGVLELGGAAGFSMAGDLTTASISPQIGYFVADNVQLSAITDLKYANTDEGDGAVTVTGLVEPSYHLPFTDTLFGFAGIGAGVKYAEGAGTGLAVVPRLGMNMLVGRSGIFTPAVNVGYSTVDARDADNQSAGTLLTVKPSVGVSAGYTVMW